MRRAIRRVLYSGVVATLVTWLLPVAAHAGKNLNHNETLVRAR